MNEDPKLKAFGIWLTAHTEEKQLELISICANDKAGIESVKRKFGHYENAKHILQVFSELYQNNLDKFNSEHLGIKEPDDNDS